MQLADTPSMPRISSHRVAQGQSFLRLLERDIRPPAERAAVSIASRVAGRRKSAVPPRLGLLRLAPRLSVLRGNRREPDWQVIAGGIGAAITNRVDAEDAPWCA